MFFGRETRHKSAEYFSEERTCGYAWMSNYDVLWCLLSRNTFTRSFWFANENRWKYVIIRQGQDVKLPCSCHANRRVRRSCRSPRCSSKLWKCLCQNVSNKTWATHFWHEKLTSNPWATHEQDMRNSFFCPVCSWLKRRYGPRQPVAILNLALSWSFFWDETPLPPPVSRTDPETIHSASSKRSKCLESQIDQFESRSHVATFVQRMQTWIEFKIAFVPCRAGLLAEKHVGCTLPVHFVEKDEQCHFRYLEETVSQMFFGFLSQLVVSWGRRQNLWDNKLLSLV